MRREASTCMYADNAVDNATVTDGYFAALVQWQSHQNCLHQTQRRSRCGVTAQVAVWIATQALQVAQRGSV